MQVTRIWHYPAGDGDSAYELPGSSAESALRWKLFVVECWNGRVIILIESGGFATVQSKADILINTFILNSHPLHPPFTVTTPLPLPPPL